MLRSEDGEEEGSDENGAGESLRRSINADYGRPSITGGVAELDIRTGTGPAGCRKTREQGGKLARSACSR